MTKYLMMLIFAIVVYSCSKSGTTPSSPGLSGKYFLYKTVDSFYNPNSKFVASVLELTLTGDTVFNYYGAGQVTIQPHYLTSQDLAYDLSDTLNFLSSGTGIRNFNKIQTPFSYNLKNGTFNSDLSSGNISLINKIAMLNNSDIQISSEEVINGYIKTYLLSYYRKL